MVLRIKTILSEVNGMRNWVERLVKCGIPEKTAQAIIDFFFKNRRTVELIAYVSAIRYRTASIPRTCRCRRAAS